MLISALLRLLRQHDVPRVEAPAKKGETYAEVAGAGISDHTPAPGLGEAKKEDLEAAQFIRPTIPAEKAPLLPGSNGEYASFIKAVDPFVKTPHDHALDVFE